MESACCHSLVPMLDYSFCAINDRSTVHVSTIHIKLSCQENTLHIKQLAIELAISFDSTDYTATYQAMAFDCLCRRRKGRFWDRHRAEFQVDDALKKMRVMFSVNSRNQDKKWRCRSWRRQIRTIVKGRVSLVGYPDRQLANQQHTSR